MEQMMRTKRNIDIVFCIDGTQSMYACIEKVKSYTRTFAEEFYQFMLEKGSEVESLRAKVITFRDYLDDGADAMQESRFFELPDDEDEYAAYVNGITHFGGGDLPENGLEALSLAMKSDFVTGAKDRQIIVLFTDADALNFGDRKDCSNYPTDMPTSLAELANLWSSGLAQGSPYKLNERTKRLVVYAPAKVDDVETNYYKLSSLLNRVTYIPVTGGEGLQEVDFLEVIKAIAASASAR